MSEYKTFDFIFSITEAVHKLVWSNMLWVVTSGLPIIPLLFGDWLVSIFLFIFIGPPGTMALFHIMFIWSEGRGFSVWKEYWRGWKIYWRCSYYTLGTYYLIGCLLVIDFFSVVSAPQQFIKWIGLLFLPILFLYFLTSITIIPLYIRYKWRVKKLFKNAIFFSTAHLFSNFFLLISLTITSMLVFQIMQPIFIFSFASSIAFLFTRQTNKILFRINKMNQFHNSSL